MTTAVTGTTPSTTSTTSTNSQDALNQLSGNFSTFLTLLTTQLKNQDPTSPMDSNTFTQQLVMYSQVEQQINTNDNLKTLISQGTTNAGAMAASYLGKKVSITNGNGSLTNGSAAWTYTLDTASATTQLAITDSKGNTVYTTTGETTSGNHSFTWNGQDTNGNQLADGTYKLTVTAADDASNKVTTSVASAGTVSQIDMTSGTPQLVVDNMELGLGDVAVIGN